MKTKFLIAVIALFFGATFNATAQQKKGKKVYHKSHKRAKHKKPQGPVILLPPPPPAPGTHPSKASLKPKAVRLPAPPKPVLPPPPPHPGGRK